MVVYEHADIVPLAQMAVPERTMSNPWLFDAESFNHTPSIRDGLFDHVEPNERWKAECTYRVDGARFIYNLGDKHLNLHYCTVATGAVFFHRFYMFYSFRQFPIYPMAATCLFLAGKAEETPKKSNDIIKFAKTMLDEQEFAQFGPDPKEEILTLERILLQTLRFDLEVEHPYAYLVKYIKQIKVRCLPDNTNLEPSKALLQSAWTFMNDSRCSTVCLQYEPEIVAIAMLFLACKIGEFEIEDWEGRIPSVHKNWWDAHVSDLDEGTLENVCHRVLDVLESANSATSANTL